MIVIGLDLSSTCTGICLNDGSTEHYAPKGDLLERALATKRWLADYLLPADLVVIEAIGTRFVQVAIAMGYMHCQVDEMLQGTRVIKVSPNELKKFATGKGSADKHQMTVAAIKAGWSSEDSTDDEADAFHLFCLGKALLNEWTVPATSHRVEICGKIGWLQ